MTCGKGTNHSWFPLAFRSRCPFGGLKGHWVGSFAFRSHCSFGKLKSLHARALAFRSHCPFGGSHCPFGGLKGLHARSLLFRRAQEPLRWVIALSAGSRAIWLGHCPFGGLKGLCVGALPFRQAQGPLRSVIMRAQGPSGINKIEFDWRWKMVLELVERTMLSHIFTLKSAFHD